MTKLQERPEAKASVPLEVLLSEAKGHKIEKTAVGSLLSSTGSSRKDKGPKGKDQWTGGSRIASLWCAKYRQLNLGRYGSLTMKEKTLLRRLVDEHGEEKTRLMALHYLENFRSIRELSQSYPSISALYGFRRLLLLRIEPRRGQFDGDQSEKTDYERLWKEREGIQ